MSTDQTSFYSKLSERLFPDSVRVSKVSGLFVLCFGLFMTGLFSYVAVRIKQEDEKMRFNQLSEALVDIVSTRIQAYQNVLIATRGLFMSSENVTKAEFHDYIAGFRIQDNFPGLLGVGYSKAIPPQELEKLQLVERKEGVPNFTVWPVGPRDIYFPVLYLEPSDEQTERVLGFDMFSEITRRRAMETARDSGEPTFSDNLAFVAENQAEVKSGFNLYIPMYKKGLPISTVSQRQEALEGFIYGALRVNAVFSSVLHELRYGQTHVNFAVYQGDLQDPNRKMFESGHKVASDSDHPHYHKSYNLEVARNRWLIHIDSTPELENKQARLLPWYILILGSIISFLVYFNLLFAGNINEKLRNELILKDKIEKEVIKTQLAAQEASVAKSRFLANVSHEIRTPLGIIIGFADLALNPQISLEEIRNYLKSIRRNGQQLAQIVNEVLDMSKIEANKMEVESMRFSLPLLIEEVVRLLESQADEKGIELIWERQSDIPEILFTDPTKLRQILINLVGNAIKFTEQGSVRIVPRLLSKPVLGETIQLEISIIDTGIGIAESERNNLFKPFSQADASTTRRYGGTGLGLTLSREFAHCIHGEVVLVSSIPKVGSVFAVQIPAGPFEGFWNPSQSSLAGEPRKGDNQWPQTSLRGVRILLVEDSKDNQLLFGRYLKGAGAELDFADNGAQGLQQALTAEYDLVLMDLQMPILDGHDVVKQLRSQGYKKPIVAITAHAFNEERERAFRDGFNGYLTKPIPGKVLVQEVRNYVHLFSPEKSQDLN